MLGWVAQVCGLVLVVVTLADVFLTVLYARIGTAFLTEALGAGLWRVSKWVAPHFGRRRDAVLSFCGPAVLLLAVVVWVGGLVVGFALVVWPKLGSAVVTARPGEPTPTGFATAVYYSGCCLSTAANGDLVPRTAFFRLLAGVQPLIGISVVTLTLTYFLEVYNALLRRNTLAQTLHHATGGTGDAVKWLAALGAGGEFTEARGELSGVVDGMVNFFESQHFYPILIYFRFGEARYAIARKTLVIFDAITLARTALDVERYASFVQSTPVTQLWNGSMQLMQMMSRVFLPRDGRGEGETDEVTERHWRRRFRRACRRLRESGVATARDEDAAAGRYVALRRQWQRYIVDFARYMQRPMDEIEPPDADPH